MKYNFIIFLITVFNCQFSYSQATDSIIIDSTLSNSEQLFTDSINSLNSKNQLISSSRNAYNQGLEFVKKEEFEQAIISFTNSINIDSTFSSAYLERAKCYARTNNEWAINDYYTSFSTFLSKFESPQIRADLDELIDQFNDTMITILDGQITEKIKANRFGQSMWRLFLILAIIFYLIESVISRPAKKQANL